MATDGLALSPNRDTSTPRPHPRPTNSKRSAFFDALPHILATEPDLAKVLLFVGNSTVHAVARAEVYRELAVEVAIPGTTGHESITHDKEGSRPCCPGHGMKSKLLAVLRIPKYAAEVKVLRFIHPCPTHTPSVLNQLTRSSDRLEAWEFASSLLWHLSNIEELVWETGLGVGGDLWIAIGSLRGLKRLQITPPAPHPGQVTGPPSYPRLTPTLVNLEDEQDESSGVPRPKAVGLNGRALGRSWENLEELNIDGLSASGARSVASHLLILASQHDGFQPPRLHTLTISTHFADLRLCQSIAQFGALRSLRHLTLSTTGTKLKDECLQILLEQCSALESLCLNGVEGRLTENVWGKVQFWPTTLTSLEVNIAETGSHHSWVLKHLASIHEVPFKQLKRFAVRRILPASATLPFPPKNVAVPATLPTHAAESIPNELLFMLCRDGSNIEHLSLEWWEMSGANLDELLVCCPELRTLQICVKAAVLDIVGMTTAFANVPHLIELDITSDQKYSRTALKSKSNKSTKSIPPKLPTYLSDCLSEPDPSLLEVRELRKFSRRMPNFRVLRWTGRQGKGEWHFTSKKTLHPVEFIHSAVLTSQIWLDCQRQPPSFDFEDPTSTDEILEPPISPDRGVSELPSLSRTTTASSLASTTPPSTALRRSSSTGVLGLEWDSLPKSSPAPHPHWTAARSKVSMPLPLPRREPRERGPRENRDSHQNREREPREQQKSELVERRKSLSERDSVSMTPKGRGGRKKDKKMGGLERQASGIGRKSASPVKREREREKEKGKEEERERGKMEDGWTTVGKKKV